MMPLGIALQTLYPENRIAAEANRAFVVIVAFSSAVDAAMFVRAVVEVRGARTHDA